MESAEGVVMRGNRRRGKRAGPLGPWLRARARHARRGAARERSLDGGDGDEGGGRHDDRTHTSRNSRQPERRSSDPEDRCQGEHDLVEGRRDIRDSRQPERLSSDPKGLSQRDHGLVEGRRDPRNSRQAERRGRGRGGRW